MSRIQTSLLFNALLIITAVLTFGLWTQQVMLNSRILTAAEAAHTQNERAVKTAERAVTLLETTSKRILNADKRVKIQKKRLDMSTKLRFRHVSADEYENQEDTLVRELIQLEIADKNLKKVEKIKQADLDELKAKKPASDEAAPNNEGGEE